MKDILENTNTELIFGHDSDMGQRKELVNQTQRCFSEVIDFGRHRNQIKLSLANLSVVVAGVGRPAGQKQNQLPLTEILHDGYVPVSPLSNLTKGEKKGYLILL